MNSSPLSAPLMAVIGLTAILCIFVFGCAPRGHALRGSPKGGAVPAEPGRDYYIESTERPAGKSFSCSFVEFDERGDYLDIDQHQAAYKKIQNLSKGGERLMVILYVHGWKNNSHSGDVVEFNNFLRELTTAPLVKEGGYRVHGVYLGWRGNAYRHSIDEASEAFQKTKHAFGEKPIVDTREARRGLMKPLLWVPEQASYWNRKGAAEDKVSGVSLIRTVYTLGNTVRRYSNTNQPSRVFLFGHSFGALMLEQSFAPASLASLTAEWPWEDAEFRGKAKVNPLPFDLTLLLNSAAPSIYAKQYHGAMVAHRQALARHGVVGSDAPLVISLTSEGDVATAKAHRIANVFARFKPSLWRSYRGDDFILQGGTNAPKVPQHYYYQRTPGHNPLLVNHWIVSTNLAASPQEGSQFQQNMDLKAKDELPRGTFSTSPRHKGDPRSNWRITMDSPDPDWSSYKGHRALTGTGRVRSGYWIMRCPKEIMTGHNDIWSKQAMETYAALLAEVEHLRTQPPAN